MFEAIFAVASVLIGTRVIQIAQKRNANLTVTRDEPFVTVDKPDPPRPVGTVTIIDHDTPSDLPGPVSVDPSELDYLARTIWGEARNQPRAGQVAVAWVIRNRVESGRFPNTYRGVVTQGNGSQFNVWMTADANYQRILSVTDADSNFRLAKEIAQGVMTGREQNPIGTALHYLNPVTASPYWSRVFAQEASREIPIGDHTFFEGVA